MSVADADGVEGFGVIGGGCFPREGDFGPVVGGCGGGGDSWVADAEVSDVAVVGYIPVKVEFVVVFLEVVRNFLVCHVTFEQSEVSEE